VVMASRMRRYCLMEIHPDRRDAAQHRQSRWKARLAQGRRGWRRRAEMAQAGSGGAESAPRRSWRRDGAAGAEGSKERADGGMQARTLATPDQRRWYSRACTHAQRIDIGWKGRIRSWKELGASEDRSEAERGGCDRRGFYARCPCIGMKEMERCGTTLLSYAYYPLSICCAMHTLFQMFFPATASALWLGRPLAFGCQFSMSNRTM